MLIWILGLNFSKKKKKLFCTISIFLKQFLGILWENQLLRCNRYLVVILDTWTINQLPLNWFLGLVLCFSAFSQRLVIFWWLLVHRPFFKLDGKSWKKYLNQFFMLQVVCGFFKTTTRYFFFPVATINYFYIISCSCIGSLSLGLKRCT